MRKKGTKFLTILAIIFFLFSCIMAYKGYDKINNYSNPDSHNPFDDYKNAYVGGDAYNFIINGTYATGYFVLVIGGMICGTICLASCQIINNIPEGYSKNNYMQNNELPPL